MDAICQFIKQAPAGELQIVLKDIENIQASTDFLSDPDVKSALQSYYESHVTHHTLADGTRVAVTAEGSWDTEEEAANPQYADYARNVLFSLDLASGEVEKVSEAPAAANEAVQSLREELGSELQSYVDEEFSENKALGTVFIDGEDDLTIRVNLSSHSLNLKNYWGGEWLSTWDIQHTVGSDDFQLVGRIRLNNHYFEQGNVRFDMAKNYQDPVSGSADAGSVAKGIVKTIRELHETYQKSLDSVYEDLAENHLRQLRRKLPVTGKNFEWHVPKLL